MVNNKSSFSQKGEEELKNITKRIDGRWQWRKQINLHTYQITNKNKKIVEQQARNLLKQLQIKKIDKPTSNKFIDLVYEWYNNYKKDIKSSKTYKGCIDNHFNIPIFKKDIKLITYQELEKFILSINGHRIRAYCYYIINGVFKQALKQGYITRDISQFISKPKNETQKGSAFKITEQKLILEHIKESEMEEEIFFYLLTGARRSEGYNIKLEDINFEKQTIFINGTKTKNSKRYVPISKAYAEILKKSFNELFKEEKSYYTHKFKEYLDKLGIKNKKLHDLRHTYSTNLYYLGVPDKQRQLYMGHASIVMTNDIYTTLEPNITKQDILNLYKDLYPNF